MYPVNRSGTVPDDEASVYLNVLRDYGHEKAVVDGYNNGMDTILHVLDTKLYVLGMRGQDRVVLTHSNSRWVLPTRTPFDALESGSDSYAMKLYTTPVITHGDGANAKVIELGEMSYGEMVIMYGSKHDRVPDDPSEMLAQGRDPCEPKGVFVVGGKKQTFNLQENLSLNSILCYYKDLKNTPSLLVSSLTTESRYGMTAMYSVGFGAGRILRFDNFRGFSLGGMKKQSMDVLDAFTFLGYDEVSQPLADYIVSFTRSEWREKVRMVLSPSLRAYYAHLADLNNPETNAPDKDIITMIKTLNNVPYTHIDFNYYLPILRANLYSHISIDASGLVVKMATLARQITRLIETDLGLKPHDDRNSYVNKRLKSPGIALLHLFNLSIEQMLQGFYINYSPSHPIDKLRSLLEARPIQTDIEPSFEKSWGLKGAPGMKMANFVETLNHEQFILQHTHVDKSVRGRDAHSKDYSIRANQPSQSPFGDVSETPENENTGLVGARASGCYLSQHNNPVDLMENIAAISSRQTTPFVWWNHFLRKDNYDCLFAVNGIVQGVCIGNDTIVNLRAVRRIGIIPRDTEIVHDELDNIVYIKCDAGRPVVPLFVVKRDVDNIPILIFEMDNKFIADLTRDPSEFDRWRDLGYIDLIDPAEMDRAYVCIGIKEMRAAVDELRAIRSKYSRVDQILRSSNLNNVLTSWYISLDDEFTLVNKKERDSQVTTALEELNTQLSFASEDLNRVDRTIVEINSNTDVASYYDNLTALKGERLRVIADVTRYAGRIEVLLVEYDMKKPLIIDDLRHLRENIEKEKTRVEKRNSFTYCLPDPMMIVGFTSSLLIFHNQNPAPRQTFACKMIKQSRVLPSHIQRWAPVPCKYSVFPTRGPVETVSYELYGLHTHAVGVSSTIAFYIGQNLVEDMISVQRGWVERGAAHSVTSKVIQKKIPNVGVKVSRGNTTIISYVTNALPSAITKSKNPRVFENLGTNGVVMPGAVLREGDCVIGSYVETSYPASDSEYVDRSKYIKRGKTGVVKDIHYSTNTNGETVVRIHINEYKLPERGDKFANPHAQKCTIGEVEEDYDRIVFLDDGSTPDILANTHSFPSRMTVAMIREMATGLAGVLTGNRYDGTPYHDHLTWDDIGDIFEQYGLGRGGKRLAYNPRTGKNMQMLVFSGVAHCYGLVHESKPKLQHRYIGKNDARTHQSATGPDQSGGQRMGSMEYDVIETHGATDIIVQWSSRNADYAVFYTCSECDSRIYPKEQFGGVTFYCYTCQASTRRVNYTISNVGQDILHKYSNAMGFDYRYVLRPKDSHYLPRLTDAMV